MGVIIEPKCSCGYPFDQMFLGTGMNELDEKVYVPFYCDYCGTIKRGNILSERHRCGKCKKGLKMFGQEIGFFDDISLDFMKIKELEKICFTWTIGIDRSYFLKQKSNRCPNCKSEHLDFVGCGSWD